MADDGEERGKAGDLATLDSVKRHLEKVSLPDEIFEILQSEGSRIDVNVILINIVQKSAPDKFITEAKEILALTRDFEAARLDNFKARADAVIDIKQRDPDDIENVLTTRFAALSSSSSRESPLPAQPVR